jgi:hypothetical protein
MPAMMGDSSTVNGTRAHKVVLDGDVVGKVKNGETVEFELPPGRHTLHPKIEWCRSIMMRNDCLFRLPGSP